MSAGQPASIRTCREFRTSSLLLEKFPAEPFVLRSTVRPKKVLDPFPTTSSSIPGNAPTSSWETIPGLLITPADSHEILLIRAEQSLWTPFPENSSWCTPASLCSLPLLHTFHAESFKTYSRSPAASCESPNLLPKFSKRSGVVITRKPSTCNSENRLQTHLKFDVATCPVPSIITRKRIANTLETRHEGFENTVWKSPKHAVVSPSNLLGGLKGNPTSCYNRTQEENCQNLLETKNSHFLNPPGGKTQRGLPDCEGGRG